MNEHALKMIAGIATIVFPSLLLTGFVLHPNLFSPHLTRNVDDLISKFHGKAAFYVGHLIVFIAVPFIIMNLFYVRSVLNGNGKVYGLIGVVLILQAIGMMKEGLMSRLTGIVAITGLALLNNPDLDIVSTAGALLMCLAYVPLGARIAFGG